MLKLIVLRPNQSISISLHRVYIFERGVYYVYTRFNTETFRRKV